MNKQYQLSSKGLKVVTLILGVLVLQGTYYIWDYMINYSILEPVLYWLSDIELLSIGKGFSIMYVISWLYTVYYITKKISTRLATWRFSLH